MKNKLFIIGFWVVLLIQGCEGFLTVDVPDSLEKKDYWKSKDHAKAALGGVYTKLGENISRLVTWGSLRSEIYAQRRISANNTQFINQDIRIGNGLCNWSGIYLGINRTNSFLKNAHLVREHDRSFSQKDLEEMLGQAYAIRALYYFYLVRTFQNVPYQSEPYESDLQPPHAAALSEEVVLDSIEHDLKIALEYAPEGFSRPEEHYGYITKNAVRALWADVKLWRKKYEECATLCDDLILEYSGNMLTWDTWFSQFASGNSKESIFEFQYLDEGMESAVGYMYYNELAANGEALLYNVRKAYPPVGIGSTSDTVRLKRTIISNGVFKFIGISSNDNVIVSRDATGLKKVNFIFYRFREVLLMKAEALGMLGEYTEAVGLINQIRSATQLVEVTKEEMGTNENFLDKIICEHRAELAFEGKDWFVLLRIARNSGFTNLLVDRIAEHSSSSVKEQILKARLLEAESWFLPYWDTEVQNNLLLEQKEFYKGKK